MMNLDELAQKYGGSPVQTGTSRLDDLASKYGGSAVTETAAPPKDAGFFSNVGDLLVEGGKRAIGAAQISPSVISGDVGEDQAKVLAEQLAMKPSVQPKELIEAQTAFKDEAEAFEKADGFIESVGPFADFLLEFGKQVLTNPKGAAYLTAQSAANMAPQIAGMIAGGKAGAVVGSVGGPGGSAIGASVGALGGGFAAGVPLEIGSEFIGRISQELSERGLPPTEENITALLRDKTVVDKAISDARTKGVTTAAIDSLMTVGAGKFASGARRSAIDAARKEMGVAADAAKIAARADAILKARTLGQKGARVAGAVGIETAGGGISEAAGQAAAYGEVDLEDVGAEMLGELGGSTLSVPAAAYSTTQDLLRSKARKDAAAIIADEEKSRVPPVVDQESPPITPVEEDGALTPTARYDDVDGVEQTGELAPPAEVAEPAVADNTNNRIEPVFLPGSTSTTTIERDGKTTTTNRTVAETAQQKFERLSRQSGKMANAYRDKILTNQEYDKFRADFDAARQAVSEETQSKLSPAKQEILDIANKLEAAGVKGVPDGMRNAAQLNAREPDAQSMEFYRSKLQPYEKKQDAVETESYGLPEFFSSDKKESARISDLLKSGPLKTRIALGEANAMIQRLAQTIQAAGFDVRDLVQGQVPDGIMNIKRQISNVAARAGRLANSAEAVQKKYKRANPERVKADIAGLMSDVNEAGNLIDEDQTLPLMAEEMAGVPAPVSPEVEDLLTKQRLASEDIAILSKRTRGTSLMGVLQGSLNDGEMSELAGKDRRVGKNPFISLVAKKGSRGLPMEDMVDLGRLDLFLPIQMRPGQPNYDNAESAEYIRESLRAGDFYTDDTRNEIAQIQSGIWDIQKQIDEELSLDEINREIQYAADEQRELDQEASSTATDGAFEAPEDSASTKAEEGLTESSVDEAADNQEQGEPQDFLKSQTEQEIREKQAEIDRLNKENERLNAEAERKAKADEQVGDFVLTGSSRDVDEAEARGQEPMFSSQTGTGYNISAEDQRIEDELTGKSMIQVADWAVANAPNAFARVIAEKVRNRLLAFQRKGMTLDFVIEGGSTRTNKLRSARGVAQFDWGNDDKGTTITVTLNGAAVMNNQGGYPPGVQYNTVLHELLHVATRSQFVFMPNTDPLRVQMTALFNAVAERFNADAKAGKLPPVMERYYKRMNNVLQDTDEILAWGLTDKEVQAYLDDIKVGEKSVFTELVELIRKALGLGKPYESALERLVRTSESMLDVDVDAIDAMLGKKDKQIGAKGKPSAPAVQDSLFQKESDIDSADIRYQREAELEVGQPKPSRQNIFGEPVLGTWSITVDPKMEIQDGLIYKMLDKNVDVKRIIEAVKETGKEIASKWNPYLQEELYHGRTATASKDFQNDEWLPLLKDMQEKDVTVGELEKYLLNRHAEAYNNFVAKRNPTRPEMQDGGSSVTTENAQKYLAGLSENQKQKFEALAKRVDAITKGTRKLLADTGYEKAETIDAWEKTFPNYVPLMREEMGFDYNFGSFGTGRGFDVRRDFSRSAMGSKRNVVDIIANVISARNNAISLTEKNRVAQAVYGLALEAPNPDFWMAINPEAEKIPQDALDELLSMGLDDEAVNFLMKEPKQRVLDPKKNEVMSRINTKLRENDYVLATRVNGERRYVFFNQQDPRAERAARALKNLDAQDLGTAMGIIAKVTRWMAAVNTQYNPIFGPYNFLRDAQAAALQLSTTELAGQQAEVSKEIIPSLRVIYSSLRKSRKGKKVDGDLAKLWKEFQQEGGQTGFKDNFSRTQDRSEALVNEMEKLSEGKAKAGARAVFDWLSDYNDSLENAVRLAAYKVAKKKFAGDGFSDSEAKQKAASLAKNLTVNFNRKGDVAIQMGALYAFFNAAMQGSARMVETLRGPTGKKIMAGGLMLGSMQALLLAGAGFDDEDPPEFVRAKNIIIPTGGGDYIAIPMPLGFHVIPGVSRILTEWAISGFDDTARRTTDLLGLFLDAFNPIGNSGWSVQTVTPTVLDPFVALGENKDFTGKPISRNDLFSLRPTPGYTRAREGANWFSMQLSEFLNFASGGTKYQKGMFSPTPEQIEYLVGQAFGGIGRESVKLATTIQKTVSGEELPIYKIPLYGRFVGETKGSAAESSRFYKNIEELNGMDLEIKGRRENREPIRDFMLDNPEARLLPMANKTYKAIQALRKRRTQLLERNASREAVQRVEAAITKRMKILNDRVKSIKDK